MSGTVIYEGDSYKNFYPFTINHATFEIRVGLGTLLDSLIHDNNKIILVARDSLKNMLEERYPDAIVNPDKIPNDCEEIHLSEVVKDYNLFYFSGCSKEISVSDWIGVPDKKSIMINQEDIHISKSAMVSAGVILDASKGHIAIDDSALIDLGAIIKGPAYIGKNSVINPGTKLKDVTIGPYCKVGGEVEHTTFHGYSNKQHDGYLGHSYIGEWVNLGANTNNSDLKNNYSNIRVNMGDKEIDAGMFAGCLIGDYTKTGISTMINSGTYIGLGCNVFGAGFQNKYISNFSWGMDGEKTDFDKFIQTLKIVKERRNQEITSAELELLKDAYENKI